MGENRPLSHVSPPHPASPYTPRASLPLPRSCPPGILPLTPTAPVEPASDDDPARHLERWVDAWGDALDLNERHGLEERIVAATLADLRARVQSELRRSAGPPGVTVDDAVHQTVVELPTILAAYLESKRRSAGNQAPPSSFVPYLLQTARFITRDLVDGTRRERERLARLADSFPSRLTRSPTTPSQVEIRSEVHELLKAELDRLDSVDRRILQEHAAGANFASLGRAMGMPRETVRDRYREAAAKMRRVVERALGGAPDPPR